MLTASLLGHSAHASTVNWIGTNSTWASGANWTDGTAPTNDLTSDLALFNLGTFTNQPSYGTTSINGIQVGDGSTITGPLTLAGTALSLGSGGITISPNAGTVTLNNAVKLGADQSWANNSDSLFTVGASITNVGDLNPFTLTLNGSGSGGTKFTGAISNGGTTGTTALNVNTTGGGVITLSANNTFSGGVTVTSGILRAVTSTTTLGAGTLTLAGGELQWATDATGVQGVSRPTIVTGDARITLDRLTAGASGSMSMNMGSLTIGGQTLTVASGPNVTSGSEAILFGSGNITDNSTLKVTNSPSGGVTNLSLYIGAFNIGANTLTFDGNGIVTASGVFSGNGGLSFAPTFSGTATLSGSNTYSGGTVAAGGVLPISSNASFGTGTLTLAGSTLSFGGNPFILPNVLAITGNTTFISSGGNFLTFSGTGTISNNPTITNNALQPVTISGVQTLSSNVALSGTKEVTFSGGLILDGDRQLSSTNTSSIGITLGATGTPGLSGAGNITLASNGVGGIKLLGNNNFTGSLTNAGTGTGTLTVTGSLGSSVTTVTQNSATSPLVLSSNNAFNGLIVKTGTVTGSSNAAFGVGGITLGDSDGGNNNATLIGNINGLVFANPITLAANTTGTLTIGNLLSASQTYTGGITGTNNLVIANGATGGGNLTFSTNPINIAGTITNTNTPTGTGNTTTISGGVGSSVTGIIENSGITGLTISGTLTVNPGGTTLTNNNPSGTLLLTVSGGVANTAGNLVLNNNTAIASGITLSTGTANNIGTIVSSGTGSGGVVISAPIGAGVTSITQNSPGALTLSGVNTNFAGPITLSQGTLKLGSATALGGNGSTSGTGGTLNIAGGTTLDASASTTISTVNAENWNGSFTFGGTNPLNLGTGAITLGASNLQVTNSGANLLTVGGAVTGASNLTLNANGAGGITFSNSVNNAGAITLNSNGAGAITLSGSVNNAGSITNSGTGTGLATISGAIGANVTTVTQNSATSAMTLSGANSVYTAGVTITSGTVKAGSATALGSGTVTMGDGGTLDLNANAPVTGLLSSAYGTSKVINTGILKTLTISGTGAATYAGAIGGATTALTLNGGAQTLSGANTYAGATTLTTGALNVTGGLSSTAITVSNNSLLNVSGVLSGTAALTVNGNMYGATAILSGSNSNTLATTVTAGVLQLGNAGALASSALTLNGGLLQLRNASDTNFTTASTTFGANTVIDVNGAGTNKTLTLGSTGAINLGAFTVTAMGGNGYALGLGAVTLTGAATLNPLTANMNVASVGGAFNLTLGGVGSNTLGAISTGAGTLTKNGAGTWALTGANSSTGAITVNYGTLNATSASLNPTATSAITLAAGSILQAGYDNAAGVGGITSSRPITLSAPATFDLNGYNSTLSGIISSTGALIVNGNGSLTLSGVNTYSGATYLLGGTLIGATSNFNTNSGITFNGGTLQANGAIAATKAITVASKGGVIDTNGFDSTNSGAITGVGSLTKSGVGKLTLSGASTGFSGGLVVNSGTLAAGVITSAFGVGNVTFGASNTPTLDLNAFDETTGLLSGAGSNGVVTNNGGTNKTLTLFGSGTATFAGVIKDGLSSKTVGLTKAGTGTQILTGASTYTGATIINGGTLQLDFTALGTPTNMLAATSPLTLGGGNLSLKGSATGSTAQTFGNFATTANTGSIITIIPNGGTSTTLTLGNAWTRGAGSSLLIDYSSPTTGTAQVVTAGVTTGATLTGGLYGWALVKDSNGVTGFATRSAAVGTQAITRYDDATLATTLADNSNVAATNFTTLGSTYTSGTLAWSNGITTRSVNSLTLDTTNSGGVLEMGAAANVLTITSGGVLFKGANNLTLQGGQLGATTAEVIVHQTSASGTLTIASIIGQPTGTPGVLTKDGPGTLVLTGSSNSSAAATWNLNGGILQISGSNNLGGQTLNVSNNATLEATSAGFDLNRTLAFVGSGGALQVDAGTLTESKNVSTASNLTIQGAGNLAVSGIISGAGGLTLASSGTTTLSGVNTFTGSVTLNAGTLVATTSASALGAGAAANTLQLNGGKLIVTNASGTNLSISRPTIVGADAQITSDVTAAGNGNTYTFGTLAIGNQTLTISGGSNVTGGTAGVTFGVTTLTDNATFNVVNPANGGVSLLTLGAMNNGGNNLTLTGNGNVAQGGAWGPGSGGLITGPTFSGTATLNQANNTFTGGINVKGGTVLINAAGIPGTGALTVGDTSGLANASLLFLNAGGNAATLSNNNITVAAGSSGKATIGLAGYGQYALTLGGSVYLNKDVTFTSYASSSLIVPQVVGSGGVTIMSSGVGQGSSGQSYGAATGSVTFNASNSYTGDTQVLGGTLILSSALTGNVNVDSWLGTNVSGHDILVGDTKGSQAGSLVLTSGGTDILSRSITVQAGNAGATSLGNAGQAGGNFNGNITLNKSLYVTTFGAGPLFNGVIADGAGAPGAVSLIKSGDRTSIATLANVNTYDGGTLVGSGVLLTTGSGTYGTGNAVVENGALRLSGSNLALGKTVYVGPNGAASIGTTAMTQSYLQQVIDPASSGAIGLQVAAFNNPLDMSKIGNGLMFLGVEPGISSYTYGAATLGANADGIYRLGWGGNNLFVNTVLSGTGALIVGGSQGTQFLNMGKLPTTVNWVLQQGTVTMGMANTFTGGITVNNQSTLSGTQQTVAGTTPFGTTTVPITLHSATLKLLNNGTSSNPTTTGTLSYDGASSLTVGGVSGGGNTLSLDSLNRSNNGTMVISPTGTGSVLGTNAIVKVSGTTPTAYSTTQGTMAAPYYTDANGAFLTYDATKGFSTAPSLSGTSFVTTTTTANDNFIINSTAPTLANSGTTSVYALSFTGAATSTLKTAAATGDSTLKIFSGGLSTVGVGSGNALTIGLTTAGSMINLDFNGKEAVIISGAASSGGNSGGIIFNGVVSNTGGNGLTKSGQAQVSLVNSANTFTGPVTVNQGVLLLSADGSLGDSANNVYLNAGGLGMVALSGTLSLSSARTITLGAGGGVLDAGNSTGGTAALTVVANSKISGTGAFLDLMTNAVATNANSTIALTNTANDFKAPILVTGRLALSYNDDRQLGDSSNTVSIIGGDASIQYSGATASTGRGILFADQGGAIDITSAATTLTANGPISGSGVFFKNGNGTLALTASNSFTGSICVNGGVLRASNNYALGVSDAVVSGSIGISGNPTYVQSSGGLELQGGIALGGTGGKTLYVNGTGVGSAGAIRSVSGNNSNTGKVILQSDSSIAVVSGSLILSGGITGSGGLTKIGDGTLAVGGASTFSGATVVSAGKLIVGGSLNGTPSVTVSNDATLQANVGAGTMNVDGLTLGAATHLSLSISGTAAGEYSSFASTGSVTLGGASLDLTVSYTPKLADKIYLTLGGYRGASGLFGNLASVNDDNFGAIKQLTASNGSLWAVAYGANHLTGQLSGGSDIALYAVPEPSTWALLVGSMGMLGFVQRLRRRRM